MPIFTAYVVDNRGRPRPKATAPFLSMELESMGMVLAFSCLAQEAQIQVAGLIIKSQLWDSPWSFLFPLENESLDFEDWLQNANTKK